MQDNSFSSKYKYIRSLGHGGCGEVFLAENISLGNLWAVKEIVKGEKTSLSGYIEPEILKRLNHPALPRICDVYEDENKIYIVEDYLDGTCLKQELDEKGKFKEQNVIDWAIQLCSVLDYLHSQRPNPIIYGDMKPHNIILTKEGFVKLIDFGVSAIVSSSNAPGVASYDTAFIGTKGYAAPEQFIGNGISEASDIYSLGITLIQLVTGIDPLKSITMFQNEKYARYLSPELFEILRKCVHPNPELRYKTVGLLMKKLRQYSLGTGISNENNTKDRKKSLEFTKIIAITGARGSGVSTITAAMSEHVARGSTSVCIVDLSLSGRLQKSLFGKFEGNLENSHSTTLLKINFNLSYINLSNLIENFHSDALIQNTLTEKLPSDALIQNAPTEKLPSDALIQNTSTVKLPFDSLILNKQLAQLKDNFTHIFIDVDITLLKFVQQYLNHIFIVSDMNPFNAADIGKLLKIEGIVTDSICRTSFIINKYYKGELSSRSILQSMLLNGDAPTELQELIAYAKAFEVQYDQKVYFKWMYSCFGEPLRFKSLFKDCFGKQISNIISNTILSKKRKFSHLARFIFSDH